MVLPYGGFYYLDENVLLNYDMRANLTYTKTFKDIHAITAFVGASASNADRQINAMQGVGYQYEQGGIPFIDYRIMKWWVEQGKRYYGMSKYSDRKAAFYANADYSFKHKYSITLTGRYEGSNQMGSSPSARWLPTWSVSGKWNIGMEPFMQAQNVFTNLSIRAGYGLTASMNPNASAGAVFYNQSTRRPYTSEIESSIVIDNLENSELTWEKARSLNVGIDGNMFHNRLSFNVEYWNRASFDLIQSIKVSGIGGAGYKYANSADMKGYGFDVTLNGTLLQQQDWTWKVNATFGYADNEITRYEGRPTINSLVRPNGGNTLGHPVKSLYSIVFDSLDPANGMPLLIDQTGNVARSVNTQSTETKYLKYEGPVDPPYSGGFGTNLRWKDLTLNVLFTYQAGNKIRLYPSFSNTYSDLTAFPKEFADRWVEPGDELRTTIPSIMDAYTASVYSGTYPYIAYNYSTERVAKGDFIRLKNISLAYTLPKKYIEPLKVIKDIRATLGVTNVWLLYSDKKLKGQDPEFFNSGGVAMPINTQFTMTLNVSF